MNMELNYPDTATFVKVTAGTYRGSRVVSEQDAVPVIFVQNTGLNQSNFQDTINSDAICWPDPTNEFIVDNFNRLEGMFILAPLFDVDDDDGWYRVESVTVNRDHLISNQIDNIECRLKKTSRIAGVS